MCLISTDVQDWAGICRHQKKKEEDQSGGSRALGSGVLLYQVPQAQHPGDHAHLRWPGSGERCKYKLLNWFIFLKKRIGCHVLKDKHHSWQVVRVWFCNRRQKGKRLALPLDEECDGQYYEQSPSPLNMAPSPIPSQGFPASGYPSAPPPTLYMPQLHRPDVLKQSLHPGLISHLTG